MSAPAVRNCMRNSFAHIPVEVHTIFVAVIGFECRKSKLTSSVILTVSFTSQAMWEHLDQLDRKSPPCLRRSRNQLLKVFKIG
jgi:hypothetical protein